MLLLLLLCYVVMLSSKLEAGENIKRGGQRWKDFRPKSKGAVMFPTLEIMVSFLFSDICMCVSSSTL